MASRRIRIISGPLVLLYQIKTSAEGSQYFDRRTLLVAIPLMLYAIKNVPVKG
jgi:hypothetical protein